MRFSSARVSTFGLVAVCAGVGLTALGLTGCGAVQKVEAEVKSNPSMLKGAEDESLTAAAKVELGKNAKTKGSNFSVSVKGGVATLTGSGSADAKAAAASAVKVPGVTSVTNQITVK